MQFLSIIVTISIYLIIKNNRLLLIIIYLCAVFKNRHNRSSYSAL